MNITRAILSCLLTCLVYMPLMQAETLDQLKATEHPLPADMAFSVTGEIQEDRLILHWVIAPHTYLYQKAFAITGSQAQFGEPVMPKGENTHDAYFGDTLIYRNDLTMEVPITAVNATPPATIDVTIAYQGCNDAGFCYPPQTQILNVDVPSAAREPLPHATIPQSKQDAVTAVLQHQPLALALLSFFGFGLLLAFTPCVLPMIPILSALILHEQQRHHPRHALSMALTYVLAMACTYASMGALVASLGSRLQAQLQNPWMLSATALILVLMALWLVFDHRFTVLSRANPLLHKLSETLPRGEFIGVALMGVIASLVVSPCVTAPLVGALTYIALSGNVLLGSTALFCLALGMGVPLIAVAWGGTALLPKHGIWMRAIQWILSALLLAMAINLVAPLFRTQNTQYENALPFVLIHDKQGLDSALQEAKEAKAIVLVDFYAAWCKPCIIMEHTLFENKKINSLLSQNGSHSRLLKVDLTDYNASLGEVQQTWHVFGPPAFLFFNDQGEELPALRMVGEISPSCFINQLQTWQGKKTTETCSQ